MQSTSSHHSALFETFTAMVARFRAFMDRLAPVGYQDEAGFHLGVERSRE